MDKTIEGQQSSNADGRLEKLLRQLTSTLTKKVFELEEMKDKASEEQANLNDAKSELKFRKRKRARLIMWCFSLVFVAASLEIGYFLHSGGTGLILGFGAFLVALIFATGKGEPYGIFLTATVVGDCLGDWIHKVPYGFWAGILAFEAFLVLIGNAYGQRKIICQEAREEIAILKLAVFQLRKKIKQLEAEIETLTKKVEKVRAIVEGDYQSRFWEEMMDKVLTEL